MSNSRKATRQAEQERTAHMQTSRRINDTGNQAEREEHTGSQSKQVPCSQKKSNRKRCLASNKQKEKNTELKKKVKVHPTPQFLLSFYWQIYTRKYNFSQFVKLTFY